MRKSSADTRWAFTLSSPTGATAAARGEERIVDEPSGGDDVGDRAVFKVVEQHDVGALAGRDHAAVA